jgi:outer membrane protein assembly factor BamB
MRRGVARVTQALAIGFALFGAAAAQAQITISVDDVRTLEGSAGPWLLSVPVRLPGPNPGPTTITVNYTTVAGSATAPSDFTNTSGTLVFGIGVQTQSVNVTIQGDTTDEWIPTLMQDEAFFVQLSSPTGGAVIDKGRGTVTLIDDDHPNAGIQFLTAVSTGTATSGQNKLQWRVPSGLVGGNIKVAWKQGVGCTFPLSDTDTAGGGLISPIPPGSAGAVQAILHSSRPINTPHCYSVIAYNALGLPSPEIAHVKATPIDTTGKIAWAYATGAASVVPPSVGADGIYTTDSSGIVHAMNRGAGGGDWPSTWNPVAVGSMSHNRSAVVPMGSRTRLFVGSENGGVHAIDGKTGTIVWSRSSAFGGTQLPGVLGAVQAQPAGLFKAFTGNNDMLLVGTNTSATNSFFALDPATGLNLVAPYSHPLMGNVMGQAVVDYGSNRVYFLTQASGATLFALDLGPSGAPALNLVTTLPFANPLPEPPGSTGSAVLRANHLTWGDSSSQVNGLDLLAGTAVYTNSTGDGPVKGFVWPDRRDNRIYFSSNNNVQCLKDLGNGFTSCGGSWPVSVNSPSMVLQIPGTDFIYVGDSNGNLVQINVSNQSKTTLPLENNVQIGAASLDGPNAILVVGSASGTIYGVHVPY